MTEDQVSQLLAHQKIIIEGQAKIVEALNKDNSDCTQKIYSSLVKYILTVLVSFVLGGMMMMGVNEMIEDSQQSRIQVTRQYS